MDNSIKLALIAAGVLEFVLRLLLVVLLIATVVGLVVLVTEPEEIQKLLRPWCFEYLARMGDRPAATGDALLSRRQRRQLEYERRQIALRVESNRVLRETRELEQGILDTDL